MLNERKRKAVELLFEDTEAEVAKKLKIGLETLAHWIEELEFREALNLHMKGYQRTTARMLTLLYLECCRELREIVHDKDDKSRYKVAVDILKAGGVLKDGPLYGDDSDPIGDLIESLSTDDDDKEHEKAEDFYIEGRSGEDAETR